MKISERIRKYRKENNLTQSEFASMLFVSKQAVSKWENDRGTPDVSLLPELSKILNVSIDPLCFAITIISNIAYVGVAVIALTKMFNSEKVMFNK